MNCICREENLAGKYPSANIIVAQQSADKGKE
jgi:hypothetical protein